MFVAANIDDLLLALKNNAPQILIKDDFKNEVMSLTGHSLSEKGTLGFELGSAGTSNILGELFYQIANKFSNKPNEAKTIESKLRKYKLKKNSKEEIILSLRQLDY
ncbi:MULTISPECIES: hypothetical protein [Clostridia]|uniref:hypothetical protein n=1 Tax=Clostridia TaxID=186801 RepID=UPI000EA2A1BB|nr:MULTISPECIES: hypothetical protein [Clostridia]NBJ70641.1 hypothetical protein [Roseburia sp. 1XD42-34]RKI75944.1 hypothetical protein D7V87_14865 [Clostridium sp. 1xD42-85]